MVFELFASMSPASADRFFELSAGSELEGLTFNSIVPGACCGVAGQRGATGLPAPALRLRLDCPSLCWAPTPVRDALAARALVPSCAQLTLPMTATVCPPHAGLGLMCAGVAAASEARQSPGAPTGSEVKERTAPRIHIRTAPCIRTRAGLNTAWVTTGVGVRVRRGVKGVRGECGESAGPASPPRHAPPHRARARVPQWGDGDDMYNPARPQLKHAQRHLLSLTTAGAAAKDYRFAVTLGPAPQMDAKSTVVGQVKHRRRTGIGAGEGRRRAAGCRAVG